MNVGQHRRWWWKKYTSKIYLNLSLWFFSIISWTLRILTQEEDHYTDFLYIALKQTETGPRSLGGTPFLVILKKIMLKKQSKMFPIKQIVIKNKVLPKTYVTIYPHPITIDSKLILLPTDLSSCHTT